ncbi:alpha/beta fold hydrolase [Priestia megaterium]|uniref:alpha/beta fold hydrolase n=1 Tax=Priestia megaterium TaxID=1404 RepID=UPI000BF3350E|nr:alpha/beta hydrolase [Priestia megaterium]PFK67938.1 alpha/beta hydrolase [Priestia megaterium]RFB19485.1 alpha/beta hydrolase [Bacillus sp. ALD]
MNTTQENFHYEHQTSIVNNTRLHYVIAGSGDPIVLLHGWPQTWYEWKSIIPTLAQSHTVIVPDLRGAGLSDKPKTGYDKLTLAQDIYALVDQLGFEQISLVGHDIGGMVAFTYAGEYPENVKKLVLLDLMIPGLGLENIMDVANGGMWHFGFQMVHDLPEALITGREHLYLDHFFKTLTYNPASIKEEDVAEYVRHYSVPGALRAGFEYYRSLLEDGKYNQKYKEQKLNMPVLAYGGEFSTGDYLRQSLLPVANHVEGGSIPECGHYIAEEQPEFLIKVLTEFLSASR